MASSRLRRGSRLGKYRLERPLGQGAFASVWRARDTVENRSVALKVVDSAQALEWGRDAIAHEARIATRLSHPNIVAVRNADWIDGHFVLATDLAERSLADYAGAKRSGAVALRVLRDVAAGLAHAHAQGILHRDVKPENVLIFADKHAALADFGVSRFAPAATATVTDAGTFGYVAPEQAYGRPRLASDVFSLGIIACELLAGRVPTWPFEWPPAGHKRFLERVPAPLRPVLRKAAAFDPRRRWPDAVAFHRALERAFTQLEQRRAKKRRRRAEPAVLSPLALQAESFRRRFGPGLELRYRCHRCDGPIAEAMRACPWCGSTDNSFREITRYPLVCPSCERGVRAEWTECPWCHAGHFAGNGRPPRPDPSAERRCAARGCPGELRRFMRYCPVCKRKPGRPWSHPNLPDRCSRCRGPVSHGFFRFCPWCGRRGRGERLFGRR
jgi:RNA polymerase subunit RPABC4/transcription elongation factor Spt4